MSSTGRGEQAESRESREVTDCSCLVQDVVSKRKVEKVEKLQIAHV